MAGIGFSKPKAAIYSAGTSGTPTYSNGKVLGKGVELSLSLDGGGNDNILYADNAPAESDKATFAGGTVSLTTDNLDPEIVDYLLGITASEVTVTGVTGVKISDDKIESDAPYVGLGAIRKLQINNQIKYQAVVFCKVQFAAGGEDWTTQGETIEWQTPTIEATLMRDDATEPKWRRRSNYLATEAEAEKVLNHMLNITAS